ncbi:MAG: heat-inducible transcriptional repressor HrcA [Streptococcaceae bacterium]|jgi:heat-inducible transcriptional repressor|nr:heat-inducible transcriptional repressor HrcA [Streptococcaceae bacterium]
MAISDRQKEILNLIISLYAKERSPIGSKSLMESAGVSSATIRNEMKALEEAGLIEKPHTSAGRVPSVSGYKYYIENVLELNQINQSELFRVMSAFDGDFYRLSDLTERASVVLSDLTGLTSFVLNAPQREQAMTHFEIAQVDGHSAMSIYTLSTGEIRTNQFIIPRSMGENDLARLKEIISERFLGKQILDIHYSLRTEIPQILSQYFDSPGDVAKLLDVMFDGLFEDKLVTSGRAKLFEFAPEQALKHYKFFSDDKSMAQEIRQATEGDDLTSVKFDNHKALKNLTLISHKFVIPYRGLGTLALIGPIDLDYQKIMTTIDLVAKVLTLKLTDYYRYLDGNHYEMTQK